ALGWRSIFLIDETRGRSESTEVLINKYRATAMPRHLEKVASAQQMRSEGRVRREIAAALGVSQATASLWTQGVLRHGRRPGDPRKLEVLPILVRMYQDGKSITQIAASTGIAASTLYDWR